MSHTDSPLHRRTAFAHSLALSGLLGVGVAAAIVVYQALLNDPVLLGGRQVVPAWTTTAFAMLLGGSLAVLVYATVLDELFHGWFDVVTGSAVLAQWGVPASFYLSGLPEVGISASFFVAVFAVLQALVALAFVGNYLRRAFPGPAL